MHHAAGGPANGCPIAWHTCSSGFPSLGGVFTITMSENFTHCYSKFHPETCPRCSKRNSWDVVGEVMEAIRSGVRRSSKTAEVINWDWGWPAELSPQPDSEARAGYALHERE